MSVALDTLPEFSRELMQFLRATLAGRTPESVADWPMLLQQAVLHGVAAFLYPTLAGAETPLPEAVRSRWRQHALAAAADTVLREAQTRELLYTLAEAHICVVPLKGIWLAEHIYAEPDQRTMSDIDILVPPADLARARDVLAGLGYTPHGITASLTSDCEQVFICTRHARPLELHWQVGMADLPPLHRPEISGLWQRLAQETLLDAPIRALCPEEHLVLLAYHILHHRFQLPLRGYLDLILLGRFLGNHLNRMKLNAIAAEWGMALALPRVIAITYDLFDQHLPAPLADWMTAADAAQRAQAIRIILLSAAQPLLQAEQTLLAFQRRRTFARLTLLLQRIFVSRDYLRREYPCARWGVGLPLAYLLRTTDLLRRNARVVCQTLQHDPDLGQQLDQADARDQLLHWALSGADTTRVTR